MKELESIKETLREAEHYKRAARLLFTDVQTTCPTGGMEAEGETAAFLENKAYLLRMDEGYIKNLISAYEKRESLNEWESALVDFQYRQYLREKKVSPEKAMEFSLIEKNAYSSWRKAYEKGDYGLFRDSLYSIISEKKERCALRETAENEREFKGYYDMLLDDYERGFRSADLDGMFENCLSAITVLKEKIAKSGKKIRTDFLYRETDDDAQRRVSDYISEVMGFDGEKGTLTVTKHAFTECISKDNVRITTYFEPKFFTSNIYSVLHEAGHALFEIYQPAEDFDWFITDRKTQGMHESVARFYENMIGRSEGFIHFIYPALKELLPEQLSDVSEREFYEGVNLVEPGLIRTDADEVTYPLHVIIRYELEKKLISGELSVDKLPEEWDDLYEKYLGIRPPDAKKGVLQDVHWTADIGYFPTYLLGNIYGAMYFSGMKGELDTDFLLRAGDLTKITEWMTDKVFKYADRMDGKEWIRTITGRELTEKDFISYLEDKYSDIYEL